MLTDFQADRPERGSRHPGHWRLQASVSKRIGQFRTAVSRAARCPTGAWWGSSSSVIGGPRTPEFVRLFHREGEIGQRLKHANIVPIYQRGTDREFHYLAMEFMEGGTSGTS